VRWSQQGATTSSGFSRLNDTDSLQCSLVLGSDAGQPADGSNRDARVLAVSTFPKLAGSRCPYKLHPSVVDEQRRCTSAGTVARIGDLLDQSLSINLDRYYVWDLSISVGLCRSLSVSVGLSVCRSLTRVYGMV
jgi:hypothetical protein